MTDHMKALNEKFKQRKLLEELAYFANYPPKGYVHKAETDLLQWVMYNAYKAMREQLAKIGKTPGDKMDDVAKVRCGEWIDVPNGSIKAWKRKCSACGMYHRGKTDFCPNCGADMRPIKEDGNAENHDGKAISREIKGRAGKGL